MKRPPGCTISMITALAENRAIGINNSLPWHLPKDFAFFKRSTLGKPIIMGRKTFESIGRPLPGRLNVVVTRQGDWKAEGVSVAASLEQALAIAAESVGADSDRELMVIGGANLYEQALPFCDRLYLTWVKTEVEGDAFFPDFDLRDWQVSFSEDHHKDSSHQYDFSFMIADRGNNSK